MPERTVDPMEMWKQWNNTTSRLWSNVMGGGKETYTDPYGLYRQWFKSMSEAQEQLRANTTGMVDPKEVWKQWFESSIETWKKASEMGMDPLGLTTQWLEMMEEARAKLLAGGAVPADPFTFYKEWYDATSETWATVVGELIGTDRFMEAVGQFLESYTSFARTMRRVNEEYFHSLQLPTRSDVARVAELVIALENKVDQVEDALETFEDSYPKLATADGITSIAGHLHQLDNKLVKLPVALEKVSALESLERRMDHLEKKMDVLLATLDRLVTKEVAQQVSTPATPRRRTQRPQAETSKATENETAK